MAVPSGLDAAGKRLWRSIEGGLPKGWELDDRELSVLLLAARQADDVAALERAIKRDGLTVVGSAGQPRLNPAVTEARQGRLAVGRLLGSIALPDEDQEPRSQASKRAQRAAQARWQRDTQRRGRRGELKRRGQRMVSALLVACDPPADPHRRVRDELSRVLCRSGSTALGVAAGEELLARHGLLARVERHIASLDASRERLSSSTPTQLPRRTPCATSRWTP